MSVFFQYSGIVRSRRLSGTPSTRGLIGPWKSAADRVFLGATTAASTFAGKNTNTARRTVDSQGSAFDFDLLCHSFLLLESSIITLIKQTNTKIAHTPI